MNDFYNPYMPDTDMYKDMTEDERFKCALWQAAVYLAAIIVGLFICALFGSCATKQSTEQTTDIRHLTQITERMDSLMHATSTWQQTMYEKQSSLVDSFKKSEVRDTSHTIFLGVKGDTVKEKIVIREFIESQHSSQESTQELREEFFRQTDSLLKVNRSMEAKMDSVLQSHQKTTVVEKKPGFMERLKWIGLGVLLALIGMFAVVSAFMKKK